MKPLAVIAAGFSCWIDSVAETLIAFHGWLAPPRVVTLIEGEPDEFTVQSDSQLPALRHAHECVRIVDGKVLAPEASNVLQGLAKSRIELVLEPGHFLFRALELPGRAAEFMEGVVRAQIDRLTPWTADESAFGWTNPVPGKPDHFVITIAAIARASIMPYVLAVTASGAQSVTVFASVPSAGSNSVPVKILQESPTAATNLRWLRRVLMIALLSAALAAVVTIGASFVIGADLDEQQQKLAHEIASMRSMAGSDSEDPAASVAAARRELKKRKHDAPIVVLVVDALSEIFPDDTYVTELSVEGGKLRLTGVTRDAPALIGLIEQSGRFSRATFFAPTTRSPTDPGERFHIEADINPLDEPRS